MFLRREDKEMPADFLVEIPYEDNKKKEKPKEVPDSSSKWRLYTDGAPNSDRSGAGLMLIDPEGPLPKAPGGLQFLTIAVEHSTKWVEAKPLTTINRRQVEKFVWEYVVCRFRVTRIISSKEEKHFKEGMFADLCKGLKITQSFSPIIKHMEIMHHIERKLTRSQQGWVDNLAKTLWIHRALPRNSEKETPFSLTYGSEAVIPIIETTDDRGRVQKATKGKESKEVASIEQAYYRNKLQKYHNARSSHPTYIVGDFILLKQNVNEWQDPYIINEVHKEELYIIVDAANQLLVQKAKGTSLSGGDIRFEDGAKEK
ncbi:reverse transcriptase domain-containing protein [Tanacetum coccineum]